MKRIAWITYDWFSDIGGKGVACTALTNELASYGYPVTLIDLEFKKGATYEDRSRLSADVALEAFDVPSMIKLIPLFPKIYTTIKQADTVVIGAAPNIDLVLLPLLLINKYLQRSTLIRVEYTNPFLYLAHPKLNVFYTVLARLLLRFVDYHIAPSKKLGTDMVRRYGIAPESARCIVWPTIPENFDALCSEAVPEALFAPTRTKPVAISVMRLSTQDKDFNTLLKAWKQIQATCDGTLVVLGNGDPEPIRAIARRYGVEESVQLLGTRTNPHAYVAKSDVMLFASHYEGNPLVLSEALAAGCPVVATDCDYGPQEIIQDGSNGFLVPVHDAEQLAKKACEILTDTQLRNQLATTAKTVKDRYRVPVIAKEYQKIIEEKTA